MAEPSENLMENLAKAFAVERQFSRKLERELECLRELCSEEVRRAAVQKAWEVSSQNVGPAEVHNEDPKESQVEAQQMAPTVRDLVAAFEQKARSGGDSSTTRTFSLSPRVGNGLVRTSSWHCLGQSCDQY